jgi:hypothetical protein
MNKKDKGNFDFRALLICLALIGGMTACRSNPIPAKDPKAPAANPRNTFIEGADPSGKDLF